MEDLNIAGDEDQYPPDVDVDSTEGDEEQQPQHRAINIRGRALQAKRPTTKSPQSVAKSGKRILVQEKRRQALELRKGGASYDQIAKAVGYSDQSGARKAVMKAFGQVIQEPVLEVKTMQIERLNHMLLTLWPKVQQGEEGAIRTALSVMDKIDALMGTAAATEVNVNVHQKDSILIVDGNKEDYIAAMKRMVGVTADGTNAQQQISSGPHPVQNPVDEHTDADIIDAVIVETSDGASLRDKMTDAQVDAVVGIMSPPVEDEVVPAVPTKKKFSFGVEPTVNREAK